MKIINVSGMTPNDPSVVYCGRETRNGWRRSPLHNPSREGKDGTREQIIAKFRLHLMERIEAGDRGILDSLDALTEDSVLGCWCKPRSCHCDVIAEVWENHHPKTTPDAVAPPSATEKPATSGKTAGKPRKKGE